MDRVIIGFIWPSTPSPVGGVGVLYEYATALKRRGHEINFIHGPTWPDRIERIDQISWFDFEDGIRHVILDDLADPSMPRNDVLFAAWMPPDLGLPISIIQGEGMMGPAFERAAMRNRMPKIVVASWLVDVGTGYGAPREQFRTICPGIDHSCFSLRVPLDQREIDVAVLYHAHPTKGWVVALEALTELHRRRPEARIVAFGANAPSQPLPDWMEYRQGPTREELAAEVYNHAKVFVQSSWNEGFGLTAVEAMACGAALVTTDNGGSSDYAVADETALLVPPGDAEALCAAASTLLDDAARRVRLASNGEQFVRRFDWEAVGEAAEAFLEEYLHDPDRFRGPPAPSDEPELEFELVYGALVPKTAAT